MRDSGVDGHPREHEHALTPSGEREDGYHP